MNGRLIVKSFPISEVRYRTTINICIAAALFVSVVQQFIAIDKWVIWLTLALAAGAALFLRFFGYFPQNCEGKQPAPETTSVQPRSETRVALPVLASPRQPPVLWSKASSPWPAFYAHLDGEFEIEIAHQLLSHLLLHRSFHQKIPQTERIKQQLLEEFSGHDNPWMMDVPIGSVSLRIRGNLVELHVIPARKQATREMQSTKLSTDFLAARTAQ
jgi:hypothetical protein